jgi:hypothetical protein
LVTHTIIVILAIQLSKSAVLRRSTAHKVIKRNARKEGGWRLKQVCCVFSDRDGVALKLTEAAATVTIN